MMELQSLCERFFPGRELLSGQRLSAGHIHQTYKMTFKNAAPCILQAINTSVFKEPEFLINNYLLLTELLKSKKYPLKIAELERSPEGYLVRDQKGRVWRGFRFIDDVISLEKPDSPAQAFEAAKAFGIFLSCLDGIEPALLQNTIPHFHNLDHRMELLENALFRSDSERSKKASRELDLIREIYEQSAFDFSDLPLRIVHNDTKISNVLLNKRSMKGVCVIDLDTAMSGYVSTDFGDMIRTMCCTASEEAVDLEKVAINKNIFKAMSRGYAAATKSILQPVEKGKLIDGGLYIILEQAVRFLSDYIQGDLYYPVKFKDQNLLRARNQLRLLQSLHTQKDELESIVRGLY